MSSNEADVAVSITNTGSKFSARPQTLLDWAEDGRAVLTSILDESHAPAHMRVMRTFTQVEVLGLVGTGMEKVLRAWVRENVAPRHSKTTSEKRVRMTVDDIYAFLAEYELLPQRPKGSKPMRMMVGAYKGGSAKSSLTLHLAHYLASRYWRVLIVDTDPQATLTKAFGLMPERVKVKDTLKPVFDAVEHGKPIPALRFVSTHLPTVKLTPANLQLMAADISLAIAFQQKSGTDFYSAVDQAMAQIEDEFDIILMDTPPAFSFTSVATVWCANALVLPMPAAVPDFAATFDFCEMVGDLIQTIERFAGKSKEWDPVVVIHSKVETNQTADAVRLLAGQIFGGSRLEEFIPQTAAVANSFGEFKSVFEATGNTVDNRSLNRAREAYSAVGARLERIIQDVWGRQAEESAK